MFQFNNISRDRFIAIKTAVEKKSGVTLSPLDNADVDADGFNINYSFIENNGLLLVNINKTPWWCSEARAEDFITKFVEAVQ